MTEKIAYLINEYPKISHTFIRREIAALEREKIEVTRISIRGWGLDLVDKNDINERNRTTYILQEGVGKILFAVLRAIFNRPAGFLQALILATKCGIKGDRPLPYHYIYLAEACVVSRIMISQKINHVHAHFSTNSAEVAMLASVLSGCTYSFTAHGTLEIDAPVSIKITEKINRAAFVIAVSYFGKAQLFRWSDIKNWEKCHVVRCGLDLNRFHAEPTKSQHDKTLICVGRYCKEKGQLFLLRALKRVIDSGVEVRLVLAGDGEMRSELETEISLLGLESVVELTGWISSKEVKSRILNSRALIVSSFSEGLPIVIMEAMALGRPVIGTYVAGIPELVSPGKTGWLVPAGNEFGLASAIIDCLRTPSEEISAMGQEAVKKVTESHSVENSTKELARLFRSCFSEFNS